MSTQRSAPPTEFGIRISKTVFLQSVLILIAMIILGGLLTQWVPAGQYERTLVNGRETIIPGSFHLTPDYHYPVYRWLTAPFEVFSSSDGLIAIVIIAFILLVGGSFALLDATRSLEAVAVRLSSAFLNSKYRLIAMFTLFFMLLGAVFGIFEEVIPLIPLMVMISRRLGWNAMMGLGLSLLPTGFGFSAAIFNPFTIGIAQQLSGIPLFSGIAYRIFIFIVVYFLLLWFLIRYARRLDAEHSSQNESLSTADLQEALSDIHHVRGLGTMGIGFVLLLLMMSFFPFVGLGDYTMPIIALFFVVIAVIVAGQNDMPLKRIVRLFGEGVLGIAPSVILIILAMSVKQVITSGGIMDTLLYELSRYTQDLSALLAGAYMYVLVFILQFFIPSATAKAFLVIPLLSQIGDLLGLTRQSVVLAFNFGDGFSHLLYPTNPALLIALSLASVRFSSWLRWTLGIQLVVFVLTMGFLLLAIQFGYGP
ncbi:MAG: Arginine/ornithine antiporter ArcD [Candidatus Carbobacillus altaicus]|uniref:Arginine/ornithine antiporter ArcD n=1 Tax=Candidatus Carbonibacillus altaicus TaxID=2163959 RepID=A0A2R6Y3M8_9BACL|nr:MAG: Arginine/ornithine antiporter ArcD [Candidatus Carbobacillus altaicus]